MDFEYLAHLVAGAGCRMDEFDTRFKGCECVEACLASTNCSCLLYKKVFVSKKRIFRSILGKNQGNDKNKLWESVHVKDDANPLTIDKASTSRDTYIEGTYLIESALDVPVVECGDECACALNERACNNRCIQRPITLPLEVFATQHKGNGLRCKERIGKGRFVIEYVGEVIGPEEVQRRASSATNYVLTVKEYFGLENAEGEGCNRITYIDPSRRGNLARFINHSCSPNLRLVAIRIGTPLVHVGLFAKCDINPFEELTYDYGESLLAASLNGKQCYCASNNCRGFLPVSTTATS